MLITGILRIEKEELGFFFFFFFKGGLIVCCRIILQVFSSLYRGKKSKN